MIKKSIFTFVFTALIACVSAQSLQFELEGEVLADGQTVYCNDLNSDYGEYIQEMQLRNISGTDLNVIIEREIIDAPEGSLYFCWGMCFAPFVNMSGPVALAAGAVSAPGDFASHFMPNDPSDKAFVKYYAYDERHADERISVVIAYNTSENVNENSVVLGRAYPNPASSVVRFNYQLTKAGKASVSVYNLLGQEVKSQELTSLQGQATLSVDDLAEGIYFCNLKVNGQAVKTEKFVVRK